MFLYTASFESLGVATLSRWNVRPSDIERRSRFGSSVVFGWQTTRREWNTLCFVYIERQRARFTASEIWSSLTVVLVAWLFQSVTRDDSIIKSIRIFVVHSPRFSRMRRFELWTNVTEQAVDIKCLIPSDSFYFRAIFAFYSVFISLTWQPLSFPPLI